MKNHYPYLSKKTMEKLLEENIKVGFYTASIYHAQSYSFVVEDTASMEPDGSTKGLHEIYRANDQV